MRLINADELIGLFGAERAKYSCFDEAENPLYRFCGKAIKIVNSVPTIDAVEVVRCKDCRYQEHCHETVAHTKEHDGFREHWSETIEWCSRGERREETASDYYDNEGRLINNQPTCMSVCGERKSDD